MTEKTEARSARVGVLYYEESSILIVRNSKYNVWELPGGTQELPELINWTACRELREETGLEVNVRNLTLAGSAQYWGRKGSFHECTLYYTQFASTKGTLQRSVPDENISETKWIPFYDKNILKHYDLHPLSRFAIHMIHSKLKVTS